MVQALVNLFEPQSFRGSSVDGIISHEFNTVWGGSTIQNLGIELPQTADKLMRNYPMNIAPLVAFT